MKNKIEENAILNSILNEILSKNLSIKNLVKRICGLRLYCFALLLIKT